MALKLFVWRVPMEYATTYAWPRPWYVEVAPADAADGRPWSVPPSEVVARRAFATHAEAIREGLRMLNDA